MKGQSGLVRLLVGLFSSGGLVSIFLFQSVNLAGFFHLELTYVQNFVLNRLVRFIFNDVFLLGIIFALFYRRQYLVFALWVQLFGVVFILIPYLVIKINAPYYNGPLINFIHRLIINPVLMILLIPAFYYKDILQSRNVKDLHKDGKPDS